MEIQAKNVWAIVVRGSAVAAVAAPLLAVGALGDGAKMIALFTASIFGTIASFEAQKNHRVSELPMRLGRWVISSCGGYMVGEQLTLVSPWLMPLTPIASYTLGLAFGPVPKR